MTSSAPGSLRGWTFSSTDGAVDNMMFSSQLHPTITAVPSSGLTIGITDATPMQALPSSSSSSRPPSHRHSLSLSLPSQAPTSYYRRSSHPNLTERRAQRKREDDPTWVPRPPNSFMIFRREYSREHAKDGKDGEPIPEKHLSKRAGEAWALLSEAEQEVYKERAEQARKEHARTHPNYKYRPRRRQGSSSQKRPPGGGLTRREQVESFMERVSAGEHFVDSDSESSPPASQESMKSASPEPALFPPPPSQRDAPVKSLRRRRSYSLPMRAATSKNTYFLQPAACASMTGVDKRSRSAVTRPPSLNMHTGYFGMPLTPFNDPALDESVFQFSLVDSNSTAPSSPNTSLFDFSFEESFVSTSSVPSPKSYVGQIPPDYSIPELDVPITLPPPMDSVPSSHPLSSIQSIPIIPPQDPGFLFQRRQRSNTTSAIPPSPLTLISSSLANWNGEATCASTTMPASGPATFIHSASSPDLLITHHYSPVNSCSMSAQEMQRQQEEQQHQDFGQPGTLLVVPQLDDMDLDRTPKVSDFPCSIQQHPYISTDVTTPLAASFDFGAVAAADFGMASVDTQAAQDLQAYAAALQELRITPSSYVPNDTTSQVVADHMYNRYINPTPPPHPPLM